MTRLSRRNLMKLALSGTAIGVCASSATAQRLLQNVNLRGSYSAIAGGLRPGAADDQSRTLQRILDQASLNGDPVYLPPGEYRVSNISLPPNARLVGVPGATRLIYTGGGHFLSAIDCETVSLEGIEFDGANRELQPYAPGLLTISQTRRAEIRNCSVSGSSAVGIHVERSGGLIFQCDISGASGEAGIKTIEARNLRIAQNHVHDCADGGIYVWRWTPGEDGTQVSGNRVERIGAKSGGTGPFGNGINIFRAHNVTVQNNWIADCAFSAVRVNAGNNTNITGNQCLRNGETGIYVEFGFQGAVVSNNIIDGATGGISITNFNDGGRLAVVSNNLIRNLKTTGPYDNEIIDFGWGISVEADTTVTGNVIEGAPLYGINVGWGVNRRNLLVLGNIIRDAGIGISVSIVENSGPAIIKDNLIDQARQGAILGLRWKDIQTDDLVDGSDSYDGLTIEGNRATS